MKGLYSTSMGAADAPAVLLLHGLLGSSRNLHRFAEALAAEGFRVISYDQRGHGHSPWADDYSLEALASDVIDVMEEHGLKRAHLVGHSLGARVCLAAAAENPGRASSLVMLDAGIRVRPAHLDDLKDIIDPLPESYASRQAAEADLARHSPGFRQFLLANLRSDPAPPHVQRWVFDLAGVKRELLHELQTEQAANWAGLTCPALLVRGERSDSLLEEDLAEMAGMNPRARVATIPRAAHWLHVDNFAATLETVATFLKELQ